MLRHMTQQPALTLSLRVSCIPSGEDAWGVDVAVVRG